MKSTFFFILFTVLAGCLEKNPTDGSPLEYNDLNQGVETLRGKVKTIVTKRFVGKYVDGDLVEDEFKYFEKKEFDRNGFSKSRISYGLFVLKRYFQNILL